MTKPSVAGKLPRRCWRESSETLVGRGPVDGRNRRTDPPQVDSELSAMMSKMTENGISNHDRTRLLRHHVAIHLERPGLRQVLVVRRFQGAPGLGDSVVEAAQKLSLRCDRLGAKPIRRRVVQIQ